jgi:hypothetical protein
MLRIHLNYLLLLVVIILLVYIYESHSQLSVLQDTMSQLVLEIEDMKKINSDLVLEIEDMKKINSDSVLEIEDMKKINSDLVASIEKLTKAQRSSELAANNNILDLLNHRTTRYYLIVLASALGWFYGL